MIQQTRDDWPEIIDLYNMEMPLNQIAKLKGISRQRIHQYLKSKGLIKHTCNCFLGGEFYLPTKSEKYLAKKLRKLGFNVEHKKYNDHYDLLVNGKKVEVKHRTCAKIITNHGWSGKFYEFNYLRGIEKVDFFIFICGDLKKKPNIYVIKADGIYNFFHIPLNTKHDNKYHWDKIKNRFNLLSI